MATTQPALKQYKLTKDYDSPNVLPNPNGSTAVRTKTYTKGTVVSGYIPITRPEDKIVPIILVEAQWAIPVQFLEDPNATPVTGLKADIASIKNNTFAKQIADVTKTNMKSLLLGAGIGVVLAWVLGGSKIFGAIGGAITGAYLGNKMTKSIAPAAATKTNVAAANPAAAQPNATITT